MSPWITISDTTETNASEIRSNDHFNATPWITISINTTEANASPLLCRHSHYLKPNSYCKNHQNHAWDFIWLYENMLLIYSFLMILSPTITAPLNPVQAGAQTGKGVFTCRLFGRNWKKNVYVHWSSISRTLVWRRAHYRFNIYRVYLQRTSWG